MMMLIKGLMSTLPSSLKVKKQSLITNYNKKQNNQKQHKVCAFPSLFHLGKGLFVIC